MLFVLSYRLSASVLARRVSPLSGACAVSLPSPAPFLPHPSLPRPHNHSGSWGKPGLEVGLGVPTRGLAFWLTGRLAPAFWSPDFLSCLLDASELQTQGNRGF